VQEGTRKEIVKKHPTTPKKKKENKIKNKKILFSTVYWTVSVICNIGQSGFGFKKDTQFIVIWKLLYLLVR